MLEEHKKEGEKKRKGSFEHTVGARHGAVAWGPERKAGKWAFG